MGLYTVQGTDMGETSPPESSGWAGRVSDGAMHTAGPDCVALGLSFVINPENESETERVVLHWPRSGAHTVDLNRETFGHLLPAAEHYRGDTAGTVGWCPQLASLPDGLRTVLSSVLRDLRVTSMFLKELPAWLAELAELESLKICGYVALRRQSDCLFATPSRATHMNTM